MKHATHLMIGTTVTATVMALSVVDPAAATGPAAATPIDHVVVLYQENASFDHYFGTYPFAQNPAGSPAFDARPGTPTVNNLLPSALNGGLDLIASNPNFGRPFRLDRSQFVTCSQNHGYRAEQQAADGGKMDRFVESTDSSTCALPTPVPAPQVMGYFDGNTVTGLWNYAQHFALNDNSFSTNYGPSTVGALNLVAGRTSGATPFVNGVVVPFISSNVNQGVVLGDPDPFYDDCSGKSTAQLSGPNIGDELNSAGVSWGWFEAGFARPADNPETAPALCTAEHANLVGTQPEDYEPHHEPFQYFASTANQHHLPPTGPIGQTDQANHQYDLTHFWQAVDDGTMPAVSFLKAAAYQDGHPGPGHSNPLDEQHFLVETINRLQQTPEWDHTAVIVAWDDSDGLYDHVFGPNVHRSSNLNTTDILYGNATNTRCYAPAGAPPPAKVYNFRCGYGPRVPLLVISPYARDNHVDHTLTDQASVLRFIEDNWSLPRLGNDSFDADAGSLLGMFDFDHPRTDRLILNAVTGRPDNHAPTVTSAVVTPIDPTTGQTVSVAVSRADADDDAAVPQNQDPTTFRYQWQIADGDGWQDIPGATTDRLDLSTPGHGDRGDRVRVVVTPRDAIDIGEAFASSSVTVADSAPQGGQVTLDPAEPRTTDVLRAEPSGFTDPDGDALSYQYQWTNGATPLDETSGRLDLSAAGHGDKGDTVSVSVTATDGELSSSAATASATVGNSGPTLEVGDATPVVDYSDHLGPVHVDAKDADKDALTLSATGLPPDASLTDAGDGTGSISGVVTSPAGDYPAVVSATDGETTTTRSVDVAVRRERVDLAYTGSLLVSTGSAGATSASVTLRAKVSQQDDGSPGDLSLAQVEFDLYRGDNLTAPPERTVPATVDAGGLATATVAAVATDNWTVIVRTAEGNRFFAGDASDPVVVTVYQPGQGKFTFGAGWVHDPGYLDRPVAVSSTNDRGSFGFLVLPRADGSPAGEAVYTFAGADGLAYIVATSSWLGGGLVIGTDSASFTGRATVTVLDPTTGRIVSDRGGGGFLMRVDVLDGSRTRSRDRYALAVYSPSGALYHRAGTPSDRLPLGAGDVTVHR